MTNLVEINDKIIRSYNTRDIFPLGIHISEELMRLADKPLIFPQNHLRHFTMEVASMSDLGLKGGEPFKIIEPICASKSYNLGLSLEAFGLYTHLSHHSNFKPLTKVLCILGDCVTFGDDSYFYGLMEINQSGRIFRLGLAKIKDDDPIPVFAHFLLFRPITNVSGQPIVTLLDIYLAHDENNEMQISRSLARQELERRGKETLLQIGKMMEDIMKNSEDMPYDLFAAFISLGNGIIRDNPGLPLTPYQPCVPYSKQKVQLWIEYCLNVSQE